VHSINEAYSLALKAERKLLRGQENVKGGAKSEEQQCERQEDENKKLELGSMKEEP
jgi:hypothetical protein